MAQSISQLEEKLRKAVEEVYRSEDANNLTVRFVRDKVENELGLEPGFFVQPEWKDKSKTLIKSWATKLMDEDELPGGDNAVPETKPKVEPIQSPIKKSESPSRKRTKSAARDSKQPHKKRQKREETPSEGDTSEAVTEESAVSDFKDSDDSDSPKSKIKTVHQSKSRVLSKQRSKRKAKAESDESEDVSEPSFVESDEDSKVKPRLLKKTKREPGRKSRPSKSKVDSDEESETHTTTSTALTKAELSTTAKQEAADGETAVKDDDSDSEAAMMIDEKPKPKRKKVKSEASSSSRASKPKVAAKDLSPDELQIKTLQSQLTKCGVRKIWGIEMKKFGDDNKQKIKHLQGMLRDVGMTGRFSEQRAREIKELRELQADLEAVTEGDNKWGLQSGKRARGQRKILKELSDEDGEDDSDAWERGVSGKVKGEKPEDRAARVKQELAFLGDEESDSD